MISSFQTKENLIDAFNANEKKISSFDKRRYFRFSIVFFFTMAFASCNLSPSDLKGTEWISDDGKIKLEFKTETIVIRDNNIGCEYKIEGNVVTIGNAFVKIPLTYENETLTGTLIQGQTNVLTKQSN